ncbi:MAG: tRNA-dihydrouridine synthase family protein [Chloroflexi bacterium]|nr:tRNA-dihydrouridine synthase family protein [Chloroflexota bacterium]
MGKRSQTLNWRRFQNKRTVVDLFMERSVYSSEVAPRVCADAQRPLPDWAQDLKPPIISLAPMDGVADWAFREMCYALGAELTVSEFAPATGIRAGARKIIEAIGARHGKKPFLIQLYGKHPADFAHAARVIHDSLPCAGIDVNMGCPSDKVVAHSHGSALMREPEIGAEIVAALRAATPLPVSVKMRAGWDSVNAPEVARLLERAGATLLTIHGRTRQQRFTGTASLEAIRLTREAVSIPVIGNGDVKDVESARAMLDYTKVDGVMVGRGAEGNPWVFLALRQALKRDSLLDAGRWSLIEVVREHARLAISAGGDRREAFLPLRKHFVWYVRGIPGKDQLRVRAQQISSLAQFREWLDSVETALRNTGLPDSAREPAAEEPAA